MQKSQRPRVEFYEDKQLQSLEYQDVFEQPFNVDDPDDSIDSETKDPKC